MRRFALLATLLGLLAAALGLGLSPAVATDAKTDTWSAGSANVSYVASDSYGATTTKDIDQAYLGVAADQGHDDTAPILATFDETDPGAVSSTATRVDSGCVSAVKGAGGTWAEQQDICTKKITSGVGAIESPTTSDMTAMKQVEGSSYDATVAKTRRCRSWHQDDYFASFGERHKGRFCYDHHNAYVWRWGGYHICNINWGFGYTVDNTHCQIVRINWPAAQGGYFRQNWDYYKATFLFHGFPLTLHDDMHANVFPSGKIRYHGS